MTDDDTGVGQAIKPVTISWSYLTLDDPGYTPEPTDTVITVEAVNATLDDATAYWQQSRASLGAVQIRIVDLPGQALAAAQPGTILVDHTAAGFGWFVDSSRGSEAGLDANAMRIDLLSTITHEVGHLLGYQHADDVDHPVMGSHLAPGVRSLPDARRQEEAFTSLGVDRYFSIAAPLGSRHNKFTSRSELLSNDLLTPSEDDTSHHRQQAPLVRQVVDIKLLDGGSSRATHDVGGGTDDDLDFLLGGDAELRMDAETGELTGVL